MGGTWLKVNEDFKDGDTLTILDGGQTTQGDFGEQYVFSVEAPNAQGNITFNTTSRNNLIDAYGEETEDWVGKKAKVFAVKQMVGDKLRTVVYLAGDGYTMTDDGQFVQDGKDNEIPVIETDEPF